MRASDGKPDPRVSRSRAAAMAAAKALFLERGFAGTTMDEIAERANLTKRTLYNNYPDKEVLFRLVIAAVLDFAETFAHGLHADFSAAAVSDDVEGALVSLAESLAQGIMRPEVVSIRRLLIADCRNFPEVAQQYFRRAPERVMKAIAREFAGLHRRRRLRVEDARLAAEQFAYLVVGGPLDRAMMTGVVPASEHVLGRAREGVRTFLARYGRRSQAPAGGNGARSVRRR
jgi:TetR/AcrR family transcriptional repressor of mexJK operon